MSGLTIRLLHPKPGDTVVVELDPHATYDAMFIYQLQAEFKEQFPDNNVLLVEGKVAVKRPLWRRLLGRG